MNRPSISIIIPVYNSAKHLERCLDSILAQTFTFKELILVNDGSKDSSGEICDKYSLKDTRISVYHNQNMGASAARNFGLEKATGDYISFIDSDDWIEPTFYEHFFGKMDFLYDIYFQNYILHKSNGDTFVCELNQYSIRHRVGNNIDEAILYLMKEVKFGWSWIKLFKRQILMDYSLRFAEDICLREDELLTFQYCKYINSICIRPQANYHYYIYSTSLTRSFRDPLEFIRISQLLREESSYLKAKNIREYEDNYYLTNLFASLLKTYTNGVRDNMNKDNRYKVINTFLEFYHSHTKTTTLQYKTVLAKWMYLFLWYSRSPRLIDFVMQKWFNVKYSF